MAFALKFFSNKLQGLSFFPWLFSRLGFKILGLGSGAGGLVPKFYNYDERSNFYPLFFGVPNSTKFNLLMYFG